MSIKALAAFLKYLMIRQNKQKKSSLLKFPVIYKQIKTACYTVRVILLFLAAKSRLYRIADRKNKTSSNALQAVPHRQPAAELTNASNFRYFRKYTDSGNIPAFWDLCFPSSCPAVDYSSPFTQMVTTGRHRSGWETLCMLMHPFGSSITN